MVDIISERTNHDRLMISESKFGAKETKTILVEGKNDGSWLRNVITDCHDSRLIIEYRKGGTAKEEVILQVKEEEYDFGIVDMDYDFSDSQISEDTSLASSKSFCCTFGMINDAFDAAKVKKTILDSVNGDREVHAWINDYMKSSYKYGLTLFQFLEDTAKYATILRLFAGWAGNNGKSIGTTEVSRFWITDRIKASYNVDFDEWSEGYFDDDIYLELRFFLQKYKNQLSNCGINDHDYEDAISILIKHNFENVFCKNRFNNSIMKFRINDNNLSPALKSKLEKWRSS